MTGMSDRSLEELLAEHADALAAGRVDADLWEDAEPDARELMTLARDVSRVLTPVSPSPRFVSRLRRELVGQGERRVFPYIKVRMPGVRVSWEQARRRIQDVLTGPYLAGAIGMVALLALVLVRLRSLQSALARVRLPFGRQRSAVTA